MQQHTQGLPQGGGRRTRNIGLRRHRDARNVDVGALTTHAVMEVRTVAYRFLKPGRVIRAEIPFSEGAGSKIRPVVVVAVNRRAVTVIPLTSQRARFATDLRVHDLDAAGLVKESVARTGCVQVIDRSMAIEELGFLSDRDFSAILTITDEAA